jgi:hypothetical protein
MLIFKAEIRIENKKMLIDELDHIFLLVEQGFPHGEGWAIEGTDEKELPIIEVEEDEEEKESSDIPY